VTWFLKLYEKAFAMWILRSLMLCSPVILLVSGGCGSKKTVPVEGTVVMDGQPLAGAAVSFVPLGEGRSARGETDASGKFVLTTVQPGDGVQAGTYKVGVSKMEAVAALENVAPTTPEGAPQLSGPVNMGEGPPPPPKSLVPPKYLNPDTSGIQIEVKAEMAPVKIELTSK